MFSQSAVKSILKNSFKTCEERLTISNGIGGLARYDGDEYYRVSKSVSGNPWIITTMWLAQYKIALAKDLSELEETKKFLSWVVKNAPLSGILPEQLNPYTGEPVSAAPLTWSHSEYVSTVIQYIEKLKDREEFFQALVEYFHKKLPSNSEFVKELLQAEQWQNQNVNIRAILEYLMLVMPQKV